MNTGGKKELLELLDSYALQTCNAGFTELSTAFRKLRQHIQTAKTQSSMCTLRAHLVMRKTNALVDKIDKICNPINSVMQTKLGYSLKDKFYGDQDIYPEFF